MSLISILSKIAITIAHSVKHFVIKLLVLLYQPLLSLKPVYTSKFFFGVGAAMTALKIAFERDHLISWNLSIGLVYMLIIDTVLGVWKHWKLKTISSEGFGRIATKVIIYFLFLKVCNILAGIPHLEWSGDLFISGLLIREAISVIENMGVIYPNIIPKWILSKLKAFDNTGELPTPPKPPDSTNQDQPK